MARRHRLFIDGLSLHVHQRGNNRADMFHDTSDRIRFLMALQESCERYSVAVHVWGLMDNHFHLMVTPQSPEALPRAMQQTGRRYVPYFNKRHHRTGGLWEGRYSSHPITTEGYWYRCMRYVELNRVRAGLAAGPEAYPWSSYHAHAFGATDALVTPHPLYTALGACPADREAAHRELCGTPLTECELASIRYALQTGRPCGDLPALTSLVPAT